MVHLTVRTATNDGILVQWVSGYDAKRRRVAFAASESGAKKFRDNREAAAFVRMHADHGLPWSTAIKG